MPDFTLASWVIMISAPFHSILVLVSLIFIIQLAGSFILVLATLLLCATPWLYVFRRELYIGASNEKNEKKIDINHKIMLVLVISSIILLVVWAHIETSLGITPLGEDAEKSVMTYNAFFQLIFEGIGRLLVTTVIFSDSILGWSVVNWEITRVVCADEETRERVEETYQSLQQVLIRKKSSPEAGKDDGIYSDVESAPEDRERRTVSV